MLNCHTPWRVLRKNIKRNIRRKINWLSPREIPTTGLVVVGAAPSLGDHIDDIKRLAAEGNTVWVMNSAHDYIVERGITPDAMVMVDAAPDIIKTPQSGVEYFIASRCSPKVFDALHKFNVTLWTASEPGVEELMQKANRPWCAIGGGGTVSLRSLYLAFVLGYRRFHLFGVDSSHTDGLHVYDELYVPENITVSVGDKEFTCVMSMARQAEDFATQARILLEKGCSIQVYGTGLIPEIASMIDADNTDKSFTALNECITREVQP
jgi:hypothetical protein